MKIDLIIPGIPIAKPSVRHYYDHKKRRTYSYQPKADALRATKIFFMKEFSDRGILSAFEGMVGIHLCYFIPFPKSKSKKFKKLYENKYHTQKPDTDNYTKFYKDAMNKVVYKDDSQVAWEFCEKRWSNDPRTEVSIFVEKENMFINEHAITSKEELSLENVRYLVKKANIIGRSGREVHEVFTEEDSEGKHYFFQCDSLNCRGDRKDGTHS